MLSDAGNRCLHVKPFQCGIDEKNTRLRKVLEALWEECSKKYLFVDVGEGSDIPVEVVNYVLDLVLPGS